MGFQRGLTALLLLFMFTVAASGAENLMRTVRYNYTQAMRVVDDMTMTHRYLASDEWGELVVVDEVNEWILDKKWRRERVWMNSHGDRIVHYGYESGGTRSTVIFDGRETWVQHETERGTRLLPYRDALRDDPSMLKINYYPPEEPFMRYLPDYGFEVDRDYLFDRPCIIAECGYENITLIPQDGDVRIYTAWIDRDDKSILRLRGFIYWRDRVYSSSPTNHTVLDSAEIQIDNTTFETVSRGYLSASLPKETIVTVDGIDDQYTAYWYNTHLPYDMFVVNHVIVVREEPVIIPVPPPPHCRRCPPPPHPPVWNPHPGPPPDEPGKRPPRRPRDEVVEDQTPSTIKLPPSKPSPKPDPTPKPTYPVSKDTPPVVRTPAPSTTQSTQNTTTRYTPPSKPKPAPAPKPKPVTTSKSESKPKPKPTPPPSKTITRI